MSILPATSEGAEASHRREIEATFARSITPVIGSIGVYALRRGDVIRLLDRIADERGQVAADMALSHLRKLCNWRASRDDAFHSPIVKGMTRTRQSELARSRVLTDDEIRAVWAATEGKGPFAALVRFLLLTAARRSEASAMTWSEVAGADWTLPASRNKVNVDLTRPLSGAARAVLDARPRVEGRPYVFTDSRKPLRTSRETRRGSIKPAA